MRNSQLALLLVLLGCGGGSDTCPSALRDGDSCGFSGQCWRDDTFSPCLSGWCTCTQGRVRCESLAPQNGDPCGDEPITSCSYEGNQGCTTPPTSEFCTCHADGTWHCTCACYGGLSTCGGTCPDLAPSEIEGLGCATDGTICTYPDATCRCVDPGSGEPPTFRCGP